jgi:hypothetical protein
LFLFLEISMKATVRLSLLLTMGVALAGCGAGDRAKDHAASKSAGAADVASLGGGKYTASLSGMS